MKLHATIKPYKAGTKSPIFFIEGENTVGKVIITEIYPIIQIAEIILGLATPLILITSDSFYRIELRCTISRHKAAYNADQNRYG